MGLPGFCLWADMPSDTCQGQACLVVKYTTLWRPLALLCFRWMQSTYVHIYGTRQHDSMAASMHLWHSMAQHSTAQHSTAEHSTAQHSTVPLLYFSMCIQICSLLSSGWVSGALHFALSVNCSFFSFILLCTCLLVSRVSFLLFTCFCFEKTEVLF